MTCHAEPAPVPESFAYSSIHPMRLMCPKQTLKFAVSMYYASARPVFEENTLKLWELLVVYTLFC